MTRVWPTLADLKEQYESQRNMYTSTLGVDAAQQPGLLKADSDWTYAMKRDAQEILSGLWLGPYGSARDHEFLKRAGITDVLVVRAADEVHILKPKFPNDFEYHFCQVSDSQFENIIRFFADFRTLIDSVLSKGRRILVHGNAGMSRSAALVISYVMTRFNMQADQAHHYVLTRRHCISVNEGFRNQIREYENIVQAQAQCAQANIHNVNANNQDGNRKRGRDQDDSVMGARDANPVPFQAVPPVVGMDHS